MDDTLEDVILVDAQDRETGRTAKLAAHQLGQLHRAISVCIIDGAGRMLLQRRAPGKYHSAGLWANACCSHPRPGESASSAAARRLNEELGIVCPLLPTAQTLYRADVGSGLIENEFVHLFAGEYHGEIRPDPHEVELTRWISANEMRREIDASPADYAIWLRHYFTTFGERLFESPAA
ncbi:MAG: isopentenyl-diphosphate Delta-isomerase [Alphaproteobacteria bacterium]